MPRPWDERDANFALAAVTSPLRRVLSCRCRPMTMRRWRCRSETDASSRNGRETERRTASTVVIHRQVSVSLDEAKCCAPEDLVGSVVEDVVVALERENGTACVPLRYPMMRHKWRWTRSLTRTTASLLYRLLHPDMSITWDPIYFSDSMGQITQ